MPKTALGLHFAPGRITLVRLKGQMKGASADLVECLVQGPEDSRALLLKNLQLNRAAPLVASLGADSIFQRVVNTPFQDKARAVKAAPLEAEESLPLPLERLAVTASLLEKLPNGSKVFVAAAPIEKVLAEERLLVEAGFPPRAILADPSALAAVLSASLPSPAGSLVVDLDKNRCQAVFIGKSGVERYFGLSGDALSEALPGEVLRYLSASDLSSEVKAVYLSGPDTAEASLELWRAAFGVEAALLPFPRRLVTPLAQSALPWPAWAIPLGLAMLHSFPSLGPTSDFLSALEKEDPGAATWRHKLIFTGALALTLLCLWGVSYGLEASHRNKKLDFINGAIRKTFTAALPDVKNVVDEVTQLKQRVAENEERSKLLGSLLNREISPLRTLKEFSERIPQEIKVEFREFHAEPERIRVEGETTSFDAIDKIQAKLEEYPWFQSVTVSEAKAAVDQKKVIFRLTVALGPKGGAR